MLTLCAFPHLLHTCSTAHHPILVLQYFGIVSMLRFPDIFAAFASSHGVEILCSSPYSNAGYSPVLLLRLSNQLIHSAYDPWALIPT